ncbi:MAG TPA: hypothetical protein VL334_11065 [Anaerolineae bacterium]|nr:hypothetical protein [Anaerolineae bacterium]
MTSPQHHPARPRSWAANALPLALALLLTLPALRPLWQQGLQQTDDGMHHIFRLFNLDLALRAGHVGARWLADEGFGYGFPVLNFYAPLTYYAGLVFHWLGAGFVTTLELTLAAGLLLAAVTMYLFARELFGPWGAALAAVAYTWAPYHLADTWTRGALAEQWAFVWIPLLLLALLKIARGEGRARWAPTLWGGLALAGLILTHNLTVLLAAPVLAGWAVFLLAVEVKAQRLRCLGHFAALSLLGVLLSAAFWLPAIAESRLILAGQSPERFADWVSRLEPPQFLLAESWRHPYTIQDRRIEHALGQAQALIAALGLAAGIWRWRQLPRSTRLALPLWVGLLLFALFMQSRWSEAVWRHVPGLLLLQFPWRWQTAGAVATALLSGYLVFIFPWAMGKPSSAHPSSAKGMAAPAVLVLFVGAALISAALPRVPWEASFIPTTSTPIANDNVDRQSMVLYDYGRGLWLREHGSPWMFEYMPVEALALREEFFLSAGPAAQEEQPLAVQVFPGRQRPLERRFTVNSAEPWVLQLHQFYFPGWEATIDGVPVPAQPVGKLALAGVPLPAGQHEVVFRFATTPARQLGWALTLLGLALWTAGVIWLRRWRWLAIAGVVLLVYGGLVLVQRQAQPADYTPTSVAATFGGEAQLVGFHLDPVELRPGGDNTVTLNWLALRRPVSDYKIFLHLVDQNGVLWAQHDGEPGFFFTPTTRWQQGEFMEDLHTLAWREDEMPPPGRYRLFAGLYDPATSQRLPVLDAVGQLTGDQALLDEIILP